MLAKADLNAATNGRKLTEKQENFLRLYWESNCLGNPRSLAIAAGYAEGNGAYVAIRALKDEMLELTEIFLVQNAPKAAGTIVEVLNTDEPIPGIKDRLDAAKTLLDRVGLGKKDKTTVDVNVSGGVFLIPTKDIAAPIDAEFIKVNDDEYV